MADSVDGYGGLFLFGHLLRQRRVDTRFHRVHGIAGQPASIGQGYARLEGQLARPATEAIADAEAAIAGWLHNEIEAALSTVRYFVAGIAGPIFLLNGKLGQSWCHGVICRSG
jgi:hypothetical protein